MADKTETEAAFDLGAESVKTRVEVQDIHGIPFALIPEGMELKWLEDRLPEPLRRRATASFSAVDSFCLYVKEFGGESVLLTAERSSGAVVAKLDYHQRGKDGAASWNTHEAKLGLQHSPEWKLWIAANGKFMGQVEFAEFLEQNLPDITEPDGGTIMDAALHLEAKRSVVFKRAHNLTNGTTQFFYEETEEGKGKGEVKLPSSFKLAIPVYEHTLPIPLAARLRYRISDEGKLTFAYVLDRPRKAVEAAFETVLSDVADGTGIRPLLGTVTPR